MNIDFRNELKKEVDLKYCIELLHFQYFEITLSST